MSVNLSKSNLTTTDATIVADLAGDRWATARGYALKQRSRLLTAEENAVLEDAGNGYPVDVIKFQHAVQSALSLAATRAGQSMSRRAWTKECRHLLYWANAIIDQHVEGLPIYEPGQRSPIIADLKAEVARLTAEGTPEVQDALRSARRAVESLTLDLQRTQEAYRRSLDEARVQSGKDTERNAALNAEVRDLNHQVDVLGSVVGYIFAAIDEVAQSRVLGYWDALLETGPEA